jgi:hypothetical protein
MALVLVAGTAVAAGTPTKTGTVVYSAGSWHTWAFDKTYSWDPRVSSAVREEMLRLAANAALPGGPYVTAGFYANLPSLTQIADQYVATSAADVTIVFSRDYMEHVAGGICLGASTIACRTPALAKSKIAIADNLPWCQISNAAGCYDVRHIVLHEMGHVFGLVDRENSSLTVMNGAQYPVSVSSSNGGRLNYGECDVAGLQQIYNVFNAMSRYSPCLRAINVSLALGSDRTTLYGGASAILTATLKVASGSGRFTNNLLSGRGVWLEVSYDNATWHRAGAMPEVSTGVYRSSVSGGSTRYVRAVFDNPGSAEALWGATSGSINLLIV